MNSPANLKSLKQHRYDGIPGCFLRGPSRQTGATVSAICNEQAGINPVGMYTVRCETHGVSEVFSTQSEAKRQQASPAGWCPACEKILDAKEAKRHARSV